MAGKIKVLVVEPKGFWRELLARSLAGETDMEVVGTAGDRDSALRLAQGLYPDVVVSNAVLAGAISGLDLGQQIKQMRPQTGIVILASPRDRHLLTNISQLEGPGWCLLLTESVNSIPMLARAIESSALGLSVVDPKLLAIRWGPEGSRLAKLKPRYQDILGLMAQGYNNRAIAEKLAPLKEKSIENYVNRIYKEMGFPRTGPWHPRVKTVLSFLEEGQRIGPAE